MNKPTEEKKWRTRLDKLWSVVIHKRDKETCQLCGNVGRRMNAHHFFNKAHDRHGKAGLRWALENGILICFTCHMALHGNVDLHNRLSEIVKKRIGATMYVKLYLSSQIPARGKADYRGWELYLQTFSQKAL